MDLPQIGLALTPVPPIALSLCHGAYMAEIFRAGIEAIPHGQTETARATGLREGHVMRIQSRIEKRFGKIVRVD